MKSIIRGLIRSPHILEVPLAYGTVHIISIALLLMYFRESLWYYPVGLLLGGFLYTFIEYWFHRTILHKWIFHVSHKNHHDFPTKLRIIATPLLPVQIYEFVIMILLSVFFGSFVGNLFQIGISISQITMDLAHLFEHSSWQPWFLRVARDYHLLHHKQSNWETGHGLTSKFWDYIYGTLPDGSQPNTITWHVYEKYPILRHINIPLPLIDFMIFTPLVATKQTNDIGTLMLPTVMDAKIGKCAIAFISGIIVGIAPILCECVFS